MSRDRAQTHEENSLFPGIILNASEKKHRDHIGSKTIRVMLRLVLAFLPTVFVGCHAYYLSLIIDYQPVACIEYPITLLPGECKTVDPLVLDTDDCSNCLCEVDDLDGTLLDTRTKLWLINPTLPGIYIRNKQVCATANVSKYNANIAHYGVSGIDRTNDYFGDGDFIITSPGSGPLSVTAYAEPDNIPFSSSAHLYANIGGGTGPDFTFSWIPVDALDDPNARNPHASPTVTTDYTVTATDTSGTVATGTVTVEVALGVFVGASPNRINIDETTTISVTAVGGTPPYTYTYETADGDELASGISDPFLPVSPSVTTTYVVTVEDDIGQITTGNATVTVSPPPGFQVIKFSIPDTLRAGDAFSYKIIVENMGQGTATNVILRDPLPPEITMIPPTPFGCIGVDSEVTCGLGDLAPGESAEVTIDARVLSGVSGPIVNTAFVTSNETDEISDTWTSDVCPETVTNCFDLSIVKSATPLVTIGDNVTYGLSVANLGPDEATGVIVTDHLPPGFEFDPVNSTSTCSSVCSTVTCFLGNYPSGYSELVHIEATVTPQTSMGANVNTAILVSTEAQDPVPDNNSSSASSEVVVIPPNLEITGIVATPFAIDHGDSSQLGVTAVSGALPYSFLWTAYPQSGNPSDGGIASGDETLQFPWVTPLSPTEYTVLVTDAVGETASASVRVSVGFTVWADADPTDIAVVGNSSQLNATVVGGAPPYIYNWGGSGLNFCDIENPVAIPADDEEYQVFVFDNIGNIAFHSVTVTVAMLVTVHAAPEVINLGDEAELIAHVQGGSWPYIFQWTPADGLDPADLNNRFPFVSPSVSTTYEMTVTDMNGKVGTGCVHVQVVAP